MWKRNSDHARTLEMDITNNGRTFVVSLIRQGILAKQKHVLDEETYRNLTSLLAELTDRSQTPEPRAFEDFGAILFDVVLPEKIQELLLQHTGPLLFSTQELSLAWELLHADNQYLCLKHPVARRLPMLNEMAGELFGSPTTSGLQTMPEPAALIIANPSGDLLEAEEEALEIQDVLEGSGVRCDVLIGPRACTYQNVVASHLRRTPYDIIHLACHAKYLHDRETSAILLANDQLVMAQELQRTFKGEPVVFLNSCWSAIETSHGSQVSTGHLGTQVVRTLTEAFTVGNRAGRARAIIGSMWWVAESVARGFTGHFYRELLAGHQLGEALRRARKQVAQDVADPALWSTFVLFGDPGIQYSTEPSPAVTEEPAGQPASTETATTEPAPQRSQPEQVAERESAYREPAFSKPEEKDPVRDPGHCDVADNTSGKSSSSSRSDSPQADGFLNGELPWSDDARVTFVGAMTSMAMMDWKSLSTVHLMLGMTYLEQGLLSQALVRQGVDPQTARRALRNLFTRKDSTATDQESSSFSISENLRVILAEAQAQAVQETAREVGDRHLLGAMLKSTASGGLLLLKSLQLDLDELQQIVNSASESSQEKSETETRVQEQATPTINANVDEQQPSTVAPLDHPSDAQPIPTSAPVAGTKPMPVAELISLNGDLNRDAFGPGCLAALEEAALLAYRSYWSDLRSPHLFLGLLTHFGSPLAERLKERKLVDPEQLANLMLAAFSNKSRIEAMQRKPRLHREFLSENALKVLRTAANLAHAQGASQISEEDLLSAILRDEHGITTVLLRSVGLDPARLMASGSAATSGSERDSPQPQQVSELALALISRSGTNGMEVLMQWDAALKEFQLPGGELLPGESAHDCLRRTLQTEPASDATGQIQIESNPCIKVKVAPHTSTSGDNVKQRVLVYRVQLDPSLLADFREQCRTSWVDESEILAGSTHFLDPIAKIVQMIWLKLTSS